jgi:ABC-type transporter Mla maintaining outer membrane lipid asymmetry ATPase subunit MlaF
MMSSSRFATICATIVVVTHELARIFRIADIALGVLIVLATTASGIAEEPDAVSATASELWSEAFVCHDRLCGLLVPL